MGSRLALQQMCDRKTWPFPVVLLLPDFAASQYEILEPLHVPGQEKTPDPFSLLHLGFYVAPAYWKDALAQLDRLGIPNGDRGEEAKGRTPGGNQGTDMDDPAGYVIQYITKGMQ